MARLKFITKEKLLEMMENGDRFVLVEALSPKNYKQGHIPGAINIPADEIEYAAPKKIAKGTVVVTYCANYSCHASTRAARKLMELGYKKVYDYKGGKQDWKDAGMCLEK